MNHGTEGAPTPLNNGVQRVELHAVKQSNKEINSLEECLFSTWTSFHERTVDKLKAKDYIPFKILALCIENLFEKFKSRPRRCFPKYLTPGKPNHLVFPEKDVHRVALMLFQDDEKKTSPTLDEVLICSKKTTKEQVDLLCRRAFNNDDDCGKIFVVLHAHLLSYHICTHIEDFFAKHPSSDCKVVFISSSEDKGHSYFNTAFEDSLVSAPLPPPDSTLQDYLKHYQKSRTCEIENRTHPDPDGFSVRLVTSEEYGNGKSLLVNEATKKAKQSVHMPLDKEECNFSEVIDCWSKEWRWNQYGIGYSLFHLDATMANEKNRNDLIFSLAVLGGLANESSKLWVLSKSEAVMVELTCANVKSKDKHPFYKLIPRITCKSPGDVINILKTLTLGDEGRNNSTTNIINYNNEWIYLMNKNVYLSDIIQRPYQYLALYDDSKELDGFMFDRPKPLENVLDCMECLVKSCPVKNPSWTELIHFSTFLNVQLQAAEKSDFCNAKLMKGCLDGFKSFVVQFLIQMAQDFATRSVRVSDESHGEGFMLPAIEKRRQWENSPHPYIFFNNGATLSFFGFFIDQNCNLTDTKTNEIIKPNFISNKLRNDLLNQGVVFNKHFSDLTRREKLDRLCTVLDVPVTDPDPLYELTYDNVMKMLATIMRFRSNIPVVMMGETGSGKTTLVKFLCALNRRKSGVKNTIVMKVHGAVTKSIIHNKVRQAIDLARLNVEQGVNLTVLLFDEANTTCAISTIKSVMCDRMNDGEPIPNNIGLQFVAALNPYRKHSDEMILKLENAGLGYNIPTDRTSDTFCNIPMRRLVYRVHQIPESMFPLIWDFGILDHCTERLYIRQMVAQWLPKSCLEEDVVNVVVDVLCFSQEFMRLQKDECSYVSLRNVDRTLKVLGWFQKHNDDILGKLQSAKAYQTNDLQIPRMVLNLILAIGVTYYVCLQDRESFATNIVSFFRMTFKEFSVDKAFFCDMIEECQDLFLSKIELDSNIAANKALKENVWMMAICIELNIPLFLIGRPGSSKSLAKTIISDVMQGERSYSQFFKKFREIHMISFQCSNTATEGAIRGTFKQCQILQKKRDLHKYSGVVVLDEIGLAEDSEMMPLKALHPLLEDGCIDEEPEDYKKVAFIGISNWSLDPAKMNRGVVVIRCAPNLEDLEASAEGICKNDSKAYKLMRGTIKILTKGYFALYKKQQREYFGLRDFYSLIKLVFSVAKQGRTPTDIDIITAVQRNFGGSYSEFDPVEYFLNQINIVQQADERIPPAHLIFEALKNNSVNSRYILLLTKNKAALHILQEKNNLVEHTKTHFMFGSSFPQDKEYTSICCNINRIMIAMQLGHTVVLCNLNNLYESLYDALNQNYVYLGSKRYVDIGLGTDRVKCRVHDEFKLILIAEDEQVHEEFPVPLINRLEKHYLSMETIVDFGMQDLVRSMERWIDCFCSLTPQTRRQRLVEFQPGDVFVGYHRDIVSEIILRFQEEGFASLEELRDIATKFLISCATPDGIVRLSESDFSLKERDEISQIYYREQNHSSLGSFLRNCPIEKRLLQITTSSRLITATGRKELERSLGFIPGTVSLLNLQQFESRLGFEKRLEDFITDEKDGKQLVIIQSSVCSCEGIELIECAKFVAQEVMRKRHHNTVARIVFVIRVQRIAGGIFSGMSVYPWCSFHIDELREKREHDINIAGLCQEFSIKSALEKRIVSIEELVIRTVPKSASRVQTNPNRVQRRIDILLEVFKAEDSELLAIVCNCIANTLNNEVKNLKKWLLRIAMDSTHMKEGNTYQRSVWLHMQKKIILPLSICIETLDIDEGLELLLNENPLLVKLYLQCFNCMEFVNFREGSWFEGSFPFTRVIFCELEQCYKMVGASQSMLHSAFQEFKISELLLKYFTECERAVPTFVNDMVKLTFDVTSISVDALKVLCEVIQVISKRNSQTRLEKSRSDKRNDKSMQWKVVSPADIFYTLEDMKPRLVFLRNLLTFDNRLCDVVVQMIREGSEGLHFRIDVILFQKLLESNAVKPEELRKSDEIEIWCQKISKVVALHNTLVSLDTGDELLPELQILINRFSIIKLFLHYTRKSNVSAEHTLERLVMQLEHNTLKQIEGFEKFVNVLLYANKKSIKHHFAPSGIDQCVVCELGFDRENAEPVILPCGKKHVGCKICLERHFGSKAGEWTCPAKGCGKEISKTFDFESTLRCQSIVKSHTQYKNQLQFFFLDVLQLYVYANELPSSEVTERVMSFVFTTKLEQTKTKTISPFANHGIDATPVIRSFLLQLLLQGNNFDSAKEAIQRFLDKGDELQIEKFYELCRLTVYCLEDRLLQDQTLSTYGRKTVLDMNCCRELLWKQKKNEGNGSKDTFDVLVDVASMRLCIISLAPILHNLVTTENRNSNMQQLSLMKTASEVICNRAEPLQENMKCFLLRVMVNIYSRGFIKEWKQSGMYVELIPCVTHEITCLSSTDNYFICTENYIKVRRHLRDALLGNYVELKEIIDNKTNITTEWSLALYFLCQIERVKAADCGLFQQEVRKLNQELGKRSLKLLQSDHPILSEFKHCNETQTRIVSFLYYLEVGLSNLSSANYIQHALRNITRQEFFPTMMQDDTNEVISALKKGDVKRVYLCPKCGTPFGIGDCGKPVGNAGGQGKCPQCKTVVGGASYNKFLETGKSAEKSEKTKFRDKTQPGHILGPIIRFEKAKAERDLSSSEVAVTQFVLHASMALHLPHLDALKKCIHPTPQKPIPQFLMDHLENNFEQICQSLGKSNDDVMVLLFHVAKKLIELPSELHHSQAGLQNKAARQIWENDFARCIVRPEIQSFEQNVKLFSEKMEKEKFSADRALDTILFPDCKNQNNIGHKSLGEVSHLWLTRPQLNVSFMQHTVENFNDKCPNLFRLLENKKVLEELKNLPLLIQLQSELCNLFNKKIDSPVVDDDTVERFMIENKLMESDIANKIKVYFTSFKNVRQIVFDNSQMGKTAESYLKGKEMNQESSAGVLFASEHPAGQCFNALVDCLIESHNLVIDAYFDEEKIDFPEPVSCFEIKTPDQLVTYNEKEINLMLLMSSDYSLEVDGANEVESKLNEEALEQNVIKRFFAGRSKIRKDTLPRFQFRNDDVVLIPLRKKRMDQKGITLKMKGHIRRELIELRDVCHVLDCLQTTLTILQQTVDSDAGEYLTKKMEKLHLYPEHGGSALRGLKVSQGEATLRFLTLLRARWMFKHKHNPYNLIETDFHDDLPLRSIKSILKPLVENPQLDKILFHLHLFMHKRLKKTTPGVKVSHEPDSTDGILREYFGAFLECMDNDKDHNYAELFDLEIKNRHTVSVFKLLIETHISM